MFVENSMLRRCILLLIITATLPVLGISEEANCGWTPFSLSFPGYNGKMSRVYGLDFGIIGLDPQQEVTGIGLDPIYSLNKKITGLAIAGGAVNSDKLSIDTNINGLAIGGGLVRSDASINGFAISGQKVEADDINGLAIGGGALSIAVGIVSFGLLPPVDLFGVSARNSLHGVGISAINVNVNNHLNGLAVSAATIKVEEGNINGMPISPGIKSNVVRLTLLYIWRSSPESSLQGRSIQKPAGSDCGYPCIA